MKKATTPWDPDATARLLKTLRELREGSTEWTIEDFVHYLAFYKRRSEKTISNYRIQLAFMERHPKAPVALHGTPEDLIESFNVYVTVREREEGVGAMALGSDHKAIRALGAFRGIPDSVWPTIPRGVRQESRWVPSPEQVHELLQAYFGPKRSYEHQLVRYMLAFSFGFGVRAPSEIWKMRVQDVDLEHGIVTITEPKKGGSRRELVVQPAWLATSKSRASLKRWIEGARPMCSPKTDALFPAPNGEAFPSEDALASFLNRRVCGDPRTEWRCWKGDEARDGPRFEWYTPSIARHWSCNARLVEGGRTVDGKRTYDWHSVARWHGHESVKMTMSTYARAIEVNEVKYGRNWLSRAFGGVGDARNSGRRSDGSISIE